MTGLGLGTACQTLGHGLANHGLSVGLGLEETGFDLGLAIAVFTPRLECSLIMKTLLLGLSGFICN